MHNNTDHPPLLDHDYLQINYHEAGFSYLLPELLQLFREQSALYLQSLEKFLGQSNFKGLSLEAHSLKGAAGSVGAAALAEAAQTLEQTVLATDMTTATALVMHLSRLSKLTDSAIAAELELLANQQDNDPLQF
ncbi:Hpt domain-containing protein [bacterium]|nr:Hpt domain-containing protein [bacterium]